MRGPGPGTFANPVPPLRSSRCAAMSWSLHHLLQVTGFRNTDSRGSLGWVSGLPGGADDISNLNRYRPMTSSFSHVRLKFPAS